MGVPGLWDALVTARECQSISSNLTSSDHITIAAIDTSIWIYQCSAAAGGCNPTLRTFYYRLCRLVRSGIHAIFVFDGPNRPAFKRGKASTSQVMQLSSFKALVKIFGFQVWQAPGEAEAEAARLQVLGIVDVVISDDVDTLLFGATKVYRHWAAVNHLGDISSTGGSHTHLYEINKIKQVCQLDVTGMILIALLAGGDYVPAGVPGCGIKTAVQAARAGYGKALMDHAADIDSWCSTFEVSLQRNSSGHFTHKHPSFRLPEEFPNMAVLDYYLNPCVTSPTEMLAKAGQIRFRNKHTFDIRQLRGFTTTYFEWLGIDGDLRLLRTLAPALIIREIQKAVDISHTEVNAHSRTVKSTNAQQIATSGLNDIRICGFRCHPSVDNQVELRIEYNATLFVPLQLASKGLDASHHGDSIDEEESNNSFWKDKTVSGLSSTARMWVARELFIQAFPEKVSEWDLERNNIAKLKTNLRYKQRTLNEFYYPQKKGQVHKNDRRALLVTKDSEKNGHQNLTATLKQVFDDKKTSSCNSAQECDSQYPSAERHSSQTQEIKTRTSNNTISINRKSKDVAKQSRTQDERRSDASRGLSSPAPVAQSKMTIKSYFPSSKVNITSNKAKDRPAQHNNKNDEQHGGTSYALKNPPASGRSIVLRKSLPGHWRAAGLADDEDNVHVIKPTEIIDLTQISPGNPKMAEKG